MGAAIDHKINGISPRL